LFCAVIESSDESDDGDSAECDVAESVNVGRQCIKRKRGNTCLQICVVRVLEIY